MTIKHLVLSGGGPSGIICLGALQQLEKNGFWKINDILSIYAISVGSFISILLCLKFEWTTINDYIIKRPWHDVFKIDINHLIEAYDKKGIFDKNIIETFYKPFFDSKDISLEITLIDFYKLTNIELHIFTFELNKFEIVNLSYLTHPDLSLLTAVQMSSAIPMIFAPVFIDDKCYVDGGIMCNYPLKYCIERTVEHGGFVDEILGFCKISNECSNIIKKETNILDFMTKFTNSLLTTFNNKNEKCIDIKNQLNYEHENMTLETIQQAIAKKEIRQCLIEKGIEIATIFLQEKEFAVDGTL